MPCSTSAAPAHIHVYTILLPRDHGRISSASLLHSQEQTNKRPERRSGKLEGVGQTEEERERDRVHAPRNRNKIMSVYRSSRRIYMYYTHHSSWLMDPARARARYRSAEAHWRRALRLLSFLPALSSARLKARHPFRLPTHIGKQPPPRHLSRWATAVAVQFCRFQPSPSSLPLYKSAPPTHQASIYREEETHEWEHAGHSQQWRQGDTFAAAQLRSYDGLKNLRVKRALIKRFPPLRISIRIHTRSTNSCIPGCTLVLFVHWKKSIACTGIPSWQYGVMLWEKYRKSQETNVKVYYQNKVLLSQAKLTISIVVRAIPVLEIVKSMVSIEILLAAIVILVAMNTMRDNKDNLYLFSWFIRNCTYKHHHELNIKYFMFTSSLT